MSFLMMILIMVSAILLSIVSLISKKSYNDREKMSPFECGFDPKSSSRMPFSLQFFLIAVVFLIFDVEIALLLPMIMITSYSNMKVWLLTVTTFLLILLMGLYYEWNQGALDWAN